MLETFKKLDLSQLPTPCYVVDAALLEKNLQLLDRVQKESGAKVLLALKGFAMWHYAPLISQYLSGVCASGLHEAKLGREFFKGEVHTFSAAFPPADIEEVLRLSNHVIFNSFHQWQRFMPQIKAAKAENPKLAFGLRINPEQPEGNYPIYDPSTPGSRLGIVRSEFRPDLLDGITGLHFHNLCEQNVDPLERTIQAIEEKFGEFLPQMQWVNFGGGHHITKADYQVEKLIDIIKKFRDKWQVEIIIEPGEAIALGTGVYVTEVLDVTKNTMNLLIIDGSCTAHLPDVLEMPYRPVLAGAGEANEKAYTYRIGGLTCLAGDIIGDYSFEQPVEVGRRLMFMDMSHYTMVKTNTFNGVKLPAIVAWDSRTDKLEVVHEYDYEDFKQRLS
ncbi:carboxynorspermidine decarboxylase [Suttonella ornithocola]|uniref:Carboxynorspermidine/carboxyspermidine decarboxylase n=1 Tax=Suttonella ornithocola TaxID=279832 RepID=A0A380MYW2_9GAMM|nr:carboxynorspermidine decarboxylase [Suttonella ornithocola]SUO97735.1 Diaminopimelate decarboxylase [Suttonella ornithocola]